MVDVTALVKIVECLCVMKVYISEDIAQGSPWKHWLAKQVDGVYIWYSNI